MNIQNTNNYAYTLQGYSRDQKTEENSGDIKGEDRDKITLSKNDEESRNDSTHALIQKKEYDYYVNENSRFAVKIVDKESGKTLKEIPSQEEQKIHKALKAALEDQKNKSLRIALAA